MNPIKLIKNEHEQIERELKELETIMSTEEINYPNLVHVLKKIYRLWDLHEKKEESIFPLVEVKKGLAIPVKKMSFAHKELREHKELINEAINSGDNSKIEEMLSNSGKEIMGRLRKHMDKEENIFYSLALEKEFSPKEIKLINEELEKINGS